MCNLKSNNIIMAFHLWPGAGVANPEEESRPANENDTNPGKFSIMVFSKYPIPAISMDFLQVKD